MSELKPITLSNLTRFANKLKEWFVLIKDSVRSVNYNTPDSDGNISLSRVDWAGELESSSTQSSDQEFIIRASGGDASVEDGSAWLNVIYGKSVKSGYVQEAIDMEVNAMERETGDPITATLDRDTFVAYVDESSTITLTYTTDWSAAPTLYGITVTGTPIAGDQIVVEYTKGERGTITNATPTAFVATGWNLYESTNTYAHVVNYGTYGYRIDGSYTALTFSATPTGTPTALSVTSNIITGFPANWTEGYIHVTGGDASNTAIYPTWSDWGDGYSEHGVSFAAFSKDTIDLSVIMNGNGDDVDGLFPYGLLQVGTTRDEINLNLGQAISRIQRIAYSDSAWQDALDSGRPCDCDENYIYIVKANADSTALTGSYSVDGAYTVSDHGLEYFEDTTIEVLAHTIYGASLKNKLERDTLTISQQTLTTAQQGQVRTNIGAVGSSDLSLKSWTPKLYDMDTYKRDMPSSYYWKIGSLYIMTVSATNFDFSGISTMIQIRNMPCAYCIGGTVFLQGLTSTAKSALKGIWIQGTQVNSKGAAYVRENVISSDFSNASTGSQAAEFVFFGI